MAIDDEDPTNSAHDAAMSKYSAKKANKTDPLSEEFFIHWKPDN